MNITNNNKTSFITALMILFVTQGFAQVWQQKGELIKGERTYAHLGTAVSLNSEGNILAIGASGGNSTSSDGEVEIYQWKDTAWASMGNIISPLEGNFGTDVALSGDGYTLIVGAPNAKYKPNVGLLGAASIYKWDGTKWNQEGDDIIGDGGDFGFAVDISLDGKTVIIGAPTCSVSATEAGQIKVYRKTGGTWTQLGSDIHGAHAGTHWGRSVALSGDGNRIVAGGTGYGESFSQGGHVRVYQWDGTWKQVGSDILGVEKLARAGSAVAMDSLGTRIAVGSAHFSNWTGKVEAFDFVGGKWSTIGKELDHSYWCKQFGYALAMSPDGKHLAVGAKNYNNPQDEMGAVLVYYYNRSRWHTLGTDIKGEDRYDEFGSTVDIDRMGRLIAGGSHRANHQGGPGFEHGYAGVYHLDLAGTEKTIVNNHLVEVFPNPSTGSLHIRGNQGITIKSYEIVDVMAQTLNQSVLPQGETSVLIEVESLSPGTYFIRVHTDHGLVQRRVILTNSL